MNNVEEYLNEAAERFSNALRDITIKCKYRETDNTSPIDVYKVCKGEETHKIGLYFSTELYENGYEPYILKRITEKQISIDIYDICFKDALDADRYLRAEARKEHYYFGKEKDNECN